MENEIYIYASKSELVSAVTEKMISTIQRHLQAKSICNIALAGGNTPREVYASLAAEYANRVDWNRVHLFWGDERTVPPDHDDSNFKMVQQALLAHIAIPDKNVHRIRGELAPGEAAAQYATLLNKHFKEKPPRLDLILLGVGEDGHTASLFPATGALQELNEPVVALFVPGLNTWRVTLTLPVLNAAGEIIFLVAGSAKSEIVKRVMSVEQPTKDLPATLVRPENGRLDWMLDGDAAALINKKAEGK
ncbi:MAG: 6-phosphogluconolactonase [bacterium]